LGTAEVPNGLAGSSLGKILVKFTAIETTYEFNFGAFNSKVNSLTANPNPIIITRTAHLLQPTYCLQAVCCLGFFYDLFYAIENRSIFDFL
jgi:hypothetical protein